MAGRQKKRLVEHIEMPTHAELEKRGVTDVLRRDQFILVSAILNLYATVSEGSEEVEFGSPNYDKAVAFVCELSQVVDASTFFGHLDAAASAMASERETRELLKAAILLLKEKGVTRDEFFRFSNKYSDGKFKCGSKKPKKG